ncbi:hypothetical protein [Cyanobium sp. Aljojuca 7D2]|uniref:hypothetical protein n=1 Tax=Cyanobium sp. Aljojuca 7D2 TaxID=2823698 RepID=UPI0020CC1C54|nr:hypothetical protein [Cyanobium sp. Aljojuca 7D2]
MTRRRRPRRDLRCPLHPEALLLSCSPKRYLAAAADGSLRAGPVERERFGVWLRRHQLMAVEDAWIEQFFCAECRATLFWQVRRADSGALSIHPLPDGVKAQLEDVQRQLRQIQP